MLEVGATATLFITGTVGSGKTTVAEHVGGLLIKRGIPHAIVDLDQLRRSWPSPAGDQFNSALALRNLSGVAKNYWSAGARRLVLAGVIEQRSEVVDHEAAVSALSPLCVCELKMASSQSAYGPGTERIPRGSLGILPECPSSTRYSIKQLLPTSKSTRPAETFWSLQRLF